MTSEQASLNVQSASQRPFADDEIDLAQLFAKIWSRKWWVVVISGVVTALAMLYVLFAKPTYQAEVFLMPPTSADLQELNIQTKHLTHSVSVETVYKKVLDQLRSKQQRRAFVLAASSNQADLNTEEQTVHQSFSSLSVNIPKKKKALVFSSVSLNGPDADSVAETLNRYVAQVQASVAEDLAVDVLEERDRKLVQLQSQVKIKRELAKTQREDRVAQLEEAYTIAMAVGIDKLNGKSVGSVSGQNINIVNADTLFMRGSDALGAEIEVLKSRASDDPFIKGLRGLQEGIANLKAISIDRSKLHPVRIDFNAVTPKNPIKPKRRLIVAASLVLGVMLGLFVVLVVPTRKEEIGV
ncbi:MAG: Wzz/FepE/Etk N-terminal domain-containing protein [Motiliproteus sp.]